MQPGAYRDRVLVQTRTSTAGTFGPDVSAWSAGTWHWCKRTNLSEHNRAALAQRGHSEAREVLEFRGEFTCELANTRFSFVSGGPFFVAVEPPTVDPQGRFSRVTLAQEVQRS